MPQPIVIQQLHTILYVRDQTASTAFYQELLGKSADLNVPGMSEFHISAHNIIGLMPNQGIARIITPPMPHPDQADGIPRCELYLYVADINNACERALACGARIISPLAERDWGDLAAYYADPDGHIIALATKLTL